MGQVFISYSRRDTDIVDRIAASMQAAGLEIWLDRHDIRAGNQWRVQIVQAIDTCDAFVLMLSPNSAASENVRKEIDLAQDSGRTLFVVMLEPLKLPAEIRYQLAGLQFVDVQQLGMDPSVDLLIDTIKKHIATLHPMEQPKAQQAELVIRGIDIKAFGAEKQEQLLQFIAQLTSADQSALSIAGMAAGSVHVFVDMPPGSAYQLKTLALNRDSRFKQLGIASLRLAGNKKFVNTALGVLTAAATVGVLQALWLGMPSLFAPVIGVTAGKVLVISLVAVLAAGLAVSAPQVVSPLFLPPSTFTPTQTSLSPATLSTVPLSQPNRTPTAERPPKVTPTLIAVGSDTPAPIESPSPTATPQDPLVLVDTACFKEPRVNDKVVSSLTNGIRVKLIARSDDGMWWLVENPIYRSQCWVQYGDLQIDPTMNIDDIPIFYIFALPPSESECTAKTSFAEDPSCYCKWYPEDYDCYYFFSE